MDFIYRINPFQLLYLHHELNLMLNMDYPTMSGWVSDDYQDLKTNKVMSTFSDHNYSVIETNSGMR